MGARHGRHGIDDFWPRVALTPVLGVAIPTLAGLVTPGRYTTTGLVATYAWFIFVAFLTWEGNLRLYLRFQDPTDWLTRPWRRVRLLLAVACGYTVPLTTQALWGWAVVTGDPAATWRSIGLGVFAIVAAVVYITHAYETVFLLREWESDRVRSERAQREALETELALLESEIEPHALFNSLNALGHLIELGDPRAPEYVVALASAHRSLLRTRRRRLVSLEEELSLLEAYRDLLAIRYGDGLRVVAGVPPETARRWAVPPWVLPELAENAAKHNVLSPREPLDIRIAVDGDRLVVSNPVRPRPVEAAGTRRGLSNLAERLRLITGVSARWFTDGGRFVVVLPLTAVPEALRLSGRTVPAPPGHVQVS